MRHRLRDILLASALVFLMAPVLSAQKAAAGSEMRRTPDGKPDLSGMWSANNVTGYAGDAGAEAAAKDLAAGRVPWFGFLVDEPPMQPWAVERYKVNRMARERQEKGNDESDPIQYPYCFPEGFPRSYTISTFEVVQTPQVVYMLFDRNHQVRRIYMDGKEHLEGYGLSLMGTSHGRWDGDTLVVDTKDLLSLEGYAWLDSFGHPYSDELHVTERIRRTGHGVLQSEMTFDDPKAYTKPWTSTKIFTLRPGLDIAENITCNQHLQEKFLQDMKSGKLSGTP
jgi:hypothetical protein